MTTSTVHTEGLHLGGINGDCQVSPWTNLLTLCHKKAETILSGKNQQRKQTSKVKMSLLKAFKKDIVSEAEKEALGTQGFHIGAELGAGSYAKVK